MSEERQEIKIVGVDKEAIEMGSGKETLWIIPFRLSLIPNQDWERKFYEVQQRDKNVMKRKAQLSGHFIKVEITEMDDLKKILEAVQLEVTETNVLCEGDYQTKIKVRQELEALQQKQGDVTKKFKDDSDKLVF